ncbi:MAG: hypothetical protein J6P82_02455 [Bacteroidales bacterium]|nr:hypothetical protein [Bacteroidales bacterium]MBP5214095.1 hypothetical protein [Bacteroidales bacterium]MBP5764503.1 hypothetical protein [Bacteroidales bacterium]
MKKLLFLAGSLLLACMWAASCSDTETYADLVDDEKKAISKWIKNSPYVDFGHITAKDEDWVDWTADSVLTDSLHPSQIGIELGKWYRITEGDFKRLFFCIRSFGNDGLDSLRENGIEPTREQYRTAMRNKKKFYAGRNVLVRYDSLFLLTGFDYDDLDENTKADNLDPNSFLICYNWNRSYYASSYYSYYYSTGSGYECTSGGIGFPIRFLWEGGQASIICPFSLAESTYASYYYTLYYGEITYTKPTYLPQ